MEKEKSGKFGLGILVGVLITLVIGMGAFIIYDNVLSNDNSDTQIEDNDNNADKDNEQEEDNSDVKSSYDIVSVGDDLGQKKLLVNGKDTEIIGLDIYDVHYLADVDSYLLTVSGMDSISIYIVGKDANVVKKFVGNSYVVDDENTTKVLGGVIRNSYKFDNATGGFYITSDNLSQDPTYVVCNKEANDIVQYTEWFKYLGNGNFSSETNVTSVTAQEYININNINCN